MSNQQYFFLFLTVSWYSSIEFILKNRLFYWHIEKRKMVLKPWILAFIQCWQILLSIFEKKIKPVFNFQNIVLSSDIQIILWFFNSKVTLLRFICVYWIHLSLTCFHSQLSTWNLKEEWHFFQKLCFATKSCSI